MKPKIEIEANDLYDLIYTWVSHVGINRMSTGETRNEESFMLGALVFLEKLREVTPKEEESNECHT